MARVNNHEVPGSRSNGTVNQTDRDTYELSAGNRTVELKFHSGPIAPGLNGFTLEQVLQAVYERMAAMKAEVFDSKTGGAQLHVFRAIGQLKARTANRISAGVEGTKQPTPGPDGINGGSLEAANVNAALAATRTLGKRE